MIDEKVIDSDPGDAREAVDLADYPTSWAVTAEVEEARQESGKGACGGNPGGEPQGARSCSGTALCGATPTPSSHLSGDGRGRQGRVHRARHVRRQPAGLQVYSFKQPSPEELDHTFLWRCQKVHARTRAHRRSSIARYYEEVLVVQVHPNLVDCQKLPPGQTGPVLLGCALRGHQSHEHHLVRNGTTCSSSS